MSLLDGSSPRMRGKQLLGHGDDLRERIIPAHAGQTDGRSHRRRTGTDHPRACGANHAPTGSIASSDGSSPRMRGKPARLNGGRFTVGSGRLLRQSTESGNVICVSAPVAALSGGFRGAYLILMNCSSLVRM